MLPRPYPIRGRLAVVARALLYGLRSFASLRMSGKTG
jgi:hypothetical protein